MVVTFYKAAMNTELVNIESLLLRKITKLGHNSFVYQSTHNTLFYVCFCLNISYLRYCWSININSIHSQ